MVKVHELLHELELKTSVIINVTEKSAFDVKTGSHTTEIHTKVL